MTRVSGLAFLMLAVSAVAGATHVVSERAAPCLKVRSTPGGGVLACLAPGSRVEVVETANEWGRVRGSSGGEGWMALSFLAPVSVQPGTNTAAAPSASVGASGANDTAITTKVREASIPQSRVPTGVPVPLYSQIDSPAGAGFNSQVYEAASATFDCRAADDFTVPPADIQWDVGNVTVLGSYFGGPGPTPAINVEFFADGGGVPGASACSYPGLAAGVDFSDDGSGVLKIVLSPVCSLPAGDYWVSVQAAMDSTVGGQWLWGERAAPAGAPFAWENPPDGFGTGCVVWTPGGACGASAPDLLFSLSGAMVPVELQSITID